MYFTRNAHCKYNCRFLLDILKHLFFNIYYSSQERSNFYIQYEQITFLFILDTI